VFEVDEVDEVDEAVVAGVGLVAKAGVRIGRTDGAGVVARRAVVAGRKNDLVAARRRARELRLQMEVDRAERDRRIEEAATQVLVLHAELTRLREEADEVAARAGTALQQLLAEGLSAEQAGSLCDLAVAEVRRLTRRATAWVVAKTAEPATP
jgi:hypothetical protein